MASKASRISDRLFSEVPRFQPKKGMFSPLPWIFRTAMAVIPPRTWHLYTYLLMRSGPESLSWQTDKQIGHDIGIGHRKVPTHLRALTELGLIETKEYEGSRYICLVDPVHALGRLASENRLPLKVVEALNDDLEVMKPRRPSEASEPSAVHPVPEASSQSAPKPKEAVRESLGRSIARLKSKKSGRARAQP